MNAPRLTVELTLEAPVRLADGAGGFTQDWQPVGTLWAALEPRTGRDGGGDGGPLARMAWRIVVRAAPAGAPARPVAGQRFVLGPRRFLIEAVAERDPCGRFLTCFAEEETAA